MEAASRTAWRIGSRNSPLALAQTRMVIAALQASWPGHSFEIIDSASIGDRVLDRPLAEVGGKGLFTRELQAQLRGGDVDFAVHSLKDMETKEADGLALLGVMPRGDARDAFLSPVAVHPSKLPQGALLGSASQRRVAQLKRLRPDLQPVLFRGNVQTRLRKLAEGVADASLLAACGLERLELSDKAACILEPEDMLPAAGQGFIGIEAATHREDVAALLEPVLDGQGFILATLERAVQQALDGTCQTAMAAYAEVTASGIRLRAELLAPDGSECVSRDVLLPLSLSLSEARTEGAALGTELRAEAPHLAAVSAASVSAATETF